MKILGNILTFDENDSLLELKNQIIEIDDKGKIISIREKNHSDKTMLDFSRYLIIPSFSDMHLHVSQMSARGVGYDLPIEDWFAEVLYPCEEEYDAGGYKETNIELVNELWKYGIMNSVIFGSINIEAVTDLMNNLELGGLRSFVGKMNADFTGFNKARETTDESINATIHGINHTKKLSSVKYAIMPEFIPTCSDELLEELGYIAEKYDLVVQTHFAEGQFDYKYIHERFPGYSYAQVYDQFNLLRPNKTLLVHGLRANKTDIDLMRKKNINLVHCPTAYMDNPSDSNIIINKEFIEDIHTLYGSDIGGAGTLNPFHNLINLNRYSNIVNVGHVGTPLTIWDSFRIMTKENGSFFGKYGILQKGYQFSALVLDVPDVRNSSLKSTFLKYLYTEDHHQIINRFNDGKELLKPNI